MRSVLEMAPTTAFMSNSAWVMAVVPRVLQHGFTCFQIDRGRTSGQSSILLAHFAGIVFPLTHKMALVGSAGTPPTELLLESRCERIVWVVVPSYVLLNRKGPFPAGTRARTAIDWMKNDRICGQGLW